MQSQLHKHHASTEWQRVLYTESLCSREGARQTEIQTRDGEKRFESVTVVSQSEKERRRQSRKKALQGP